jgi:hypothetical protein
VLASASQVLLLVQLVNFAGAVGGSFGDVIF